jgi:hypothetical protein
MVSATKARMPSDSFSVAIASSLSAKRKPASSYCTNGMSMAWAAPASRALTSGASLAASCASRSGLMVSRSQPASAVIWPTLRKLAPITSVAMPCFL